MVYHSYDVSKDVKAFQGEELNIKVNTFIKDDTDEAIDGCLTDSSWCLKLILYYDEQKENTRDLLSNKSKISLLMPHRLKVMVLGIGPNMFVNDIYLLRNVIIYNQVIGLSLYRQ